VPRPLTVLLAVLPFLLHGLAREVDRALGLVLRSQLEPDGLLSEIVRAVGAEGPATVLRVAGWVLGGFAAWVALGAWRSRSQGISGVRALSAEVHTFTPLLLRPALTLAALVSVFLRPSYPYGFTLPVALTQDLAMGQDLAALAAFLALRLPPVRLSAPGSRAILLLSFLGYALLSPEWARQWEGHPGNEPKYLRMAVALGHGLTLDAEGVTAAMEELPTTPPGEALVAAGRALARESGRMVTAIARGEAGRAAIRATRITRQTVRGKEGGVYYVLAPGPSLLLAPGFRVDRALNRARETVGPIPVAVLGWNLVAALLVVAVFVLVRDATGRAGLGATLAFLFALLPPLLFYFFQFYPEMPGALVLAVAFHALALDTERLRRHPWLYGWMLATLPWLHQKFLPVWLALVATALWVIWRRRRVTPSASAGKSHQEVGPWVARFLVPQVLSLYLTALYNFAITGSVRPDALFLAWGPGGVTSARVGQGILGLLLDARYGILPYVPLLVLAGAGLAVGGGRRFATVLPAAAVYYLTVASADNWAGAVCNLGRYFMPLAPLGIVLVAVALDRVPARRGALALTLILAGWSVVFAVALWRDPHAANDSAVLLAKSTYADGNQYIPNLHLRTWARAAPGLWARVGAWLVVVGVTAVWWRRAAAAAVGRAPRGRERVGASPVATLLGTALVLLALAFTLEQWPAWRKEPFFGGSLALGSESRLWARGEVLVRPEEVIAGPGDVTLVLRSPARRPTLPLTVGGDGVLRVDGMRPLVLRSTGARIDVPLRPYHVVSGPDGQQAAFARVDLAVEGQAVLRPASGAPGHDAEEQRNRKSGDLVEESDG
jgi:hypothetical protein